MKRCAWLHRRGSRRRRGRRAVRRVAEGRARDEGDAVATRNGRRDVARSGQHARREGSAKRHGGRRVVAVSLENGNRFGPMLAEALLLRALARRATAFPHGHAALAHVPGRVPQLAEDGPQRRPQGCGRREHDERHRAHEPGPPAQPALQRGDSGHGAHVLGSKGQSGERQATPPGGSLSRLERATSCLEGPPAAATACGTTWSNTRPHTATSTSPSRRSADHLVFLKTAAVSGPIARATRLRTRRPRLTEATGSSASRNRDHCY